MPKVYSEKLVSGRLDGKGGATLRARSSHLTAEASADAVEPPRFAARDMRTFDRDGMRRFLEGVKGTEWYEPFYLALYTGMRRSELLALRWDDVDLDLGQVYVFRSIHRLRDGSIVYRQPKTARGPRMIAMPPSAIVLLREHRERVMARRDLLKASTLMGQDLVFSRLDGSAIPPDSLSGAWRRLARRRGFSGIRLHDARHSHASLLLKQGVHPKIVQERLGHSTVSTTLDLYSHVSPGLQEAAARRFDMLLEAAPADADPLG